MVKSKYLIIDYWQSKISEGTEMWSGLFDNIPITKDSIIINPVILNSYSNQCEDGWAIYPNVYSVIGFLKFLYLPTAFIRFIKDDQEYQYYFQDNLDEVLAEYKTEKDIEIKLIEELEQCYVQLLNLCTEDEEVTKKELLIWAGRFNQASWTTKKYTSYSINIFTSPYNAAQFIVNIYEQDEMLGINALEEEIALSKFEFLQLSGEEIFSNEFLKRKFADILTNRLKVTF